MDAAAYLKKNGWHGAGHSLDYAGRGIVKPLLISHKTDALGIGKKKTQVADQWWMRAFDESLKELGSGKQTTLSQIRENGVTRGGLYGFFIRGEGLQGTITEEETTSTEASSTESASTKATSFESTTSDSDSTQPSTNESDSEESTSSTNAPSGDSSPASDSESTMASEPAAEADIIPIADPQAGQKRKRQRESAAEIRKRRKDERAEKVKANVQRPSTVEQAEPAENGIHADRVKMINKGGYMLNDSNQPGAVVVGRGKLSYKAQKYEREKAKRIAKRVEKARLQGLVDPDSAPQDPEKPSPAGSEQVKREQKEKAKVEKRERNAAKKAKLEEKERKKAERREQKKARRALKIQHRAETARKHKELKAAKEAAERAEREAQISTDEFAGAVDEIKLGPSSNGRVKTIPGVGRVDKYPTKAEKRQKKIEARALEAGMSVEEYLAQEAAKEEAEKHQSEEQQAGKESKREQRVEGAQREAAAAAVDAADIAKDPQPVISVPASPLSDKKKEKYAARATEKGITVEEYISRRAAKKAGKESSGGVRLPSAAAAAEAPQPGSGSTVVDTTGDAALAPAQAPPAFIIDTSGDLTIVEMKRREATAKGPLVWDPSMLGSRKVKELSKEERKARLEYMRARRAAKKAGAGAQISLSKKEKAKRRAERKQGLQAKLVAEIVAQKGKKREEVTKEEVKMAQRQAKRTLRELKREKRNKVIHRGKKGFGETTKRLSMGGRNK